jgi:hypothetical protein
LRGFSFLRFKVAEVQRDKGFSFLGAKVQRDKGTKAESAILSSSSGGTRYIVEMDFNPSYAKDIY